MMRVLLFICLWLAGPSGPALGQTLELPGLGAPDPGAQTRTGPVEVDLELLLLVDVSRSMTAEELQIQRQGYAAVLQSEAVLGTIGRGFIGQIAMSYVEWAGAGLERVAVDWTLISTREEAGRFAEALLLSAPYTVSRTSISSALAFGADHFEGNGFQGLRRVIDISGDGPNNQGGPVTVARDAVLARGITINGLPLMAVSDAYDRWSVPDLDRYYEACVTGGPGAFVIAVIDWRDFAAAAERKLVLEIAGRTPTPGPRVWRAHAYDCRIGEKIWERNRGSWGGVP